ncbi:hypothetical protein [Gangjinia marincola]
MRNTKLSLYLEQGENSFKSGGFRIIYLSGVPTELHIIVILQYYDDNVKK